MATFNGTSGDDDLTAIAGDDTYQLGNGNDTLVYHASIAAGVLSWNNGNDTIIATDAGLGAPHFDRIVLELLVDYVWGRKLGVDFQLSIYAHAVGNLDDDPMTTDQVGTILLKNAFSASLADRIGRIEAQGGFYFEAIANPAIDAYGHTAIYKAHYPLNGPDILYQDRFTDINDQEVRKLEVRSDGTATDSYFDAAISVPANGGGFLPDAAFDGWELPR